VMNFDDADTVDAHCTTQQPFHTSCCSLVQRPSGLYC
jgi:hypothetical protein